MELKEHPIEISAQEKPVESPSGSDAQAKNRQAAAFISAGRAAVERALSNDSQKYLSQNQQKGGE